MLSTFFSDIDNVQTAAIITLVVIIAIAAVRGDRRFSQQHRDLQDVIKSQYEILKQINDQGKQIVDCQMQIDGLKREVGRIKEELGEGRV